MLKVAVKANFLAAYSQRLQKNYTYRFVTENKFGRSTLGTVTTVIFWYLEGACDA